MTYSSAGEWVKGIPSGGDDEEKGRKKTSRISQTIYSTPSTYIYATSL